MSRVITVSQKFPSYHTKSDKPTEFVEKIWLSLLSIGEISISRMAELSKQTGIGNLDVYKIRSLDLLLKHHTIRKGHRWKKGDYFSPRVWGNDINPKSGRSGPYHSKQITIAPDILITDVWDFEIKWDHDAMGCFINGKNCSPDKLEDVAENDGLVRRHDLLDWFKYPKPFKGQIICWNPNLNYID